MPEAGVVTLHRYRAEVDHDGTAVPPRQHKLKPLSSTQELDLLESPGEATDAAKAKPAVVRRSDTHELRPELPPVAARTTSPFEVRPPRGMSASPPGARSSSALAASFSGPAPPSPTTAEHLPEAAAAPPAAPAPESLLGEPVASTEAVPEPQAALAPEPTPEPKAREPAPEAATTRSPSKKGPELAECSESPSSPAEKPSWTPHAPTTPKGEVKSALKSPKRSRPSPKATTNDDEPVRLPQRATTLEDGRPSVTPALKSALKRGKTTEVVRISSGASATEAQEALQERAAAQASRASSSSSPVAELVGRKSCLKKKNSSAHSTFIQETVPEEAPLESPTGRLQLNAAHLAQHSEWQAQHHDAIKRAGSKCSSVISEVISEEHSVDGETTASLTAEQEDWMRPLSLSEDRPEMWTTRGLCKRAYFRSTHRVNWPKAKFAVDPSIMEIPTCGNNLPLHMQENLRGSSLGRRMSVREQTLVVDGASLIGMGSSRGRCAPSSSSAPSESSSSRPSCPKLQRSTSILICVDEEYKDRRQGAYQRAFSVAEAGGTGADKDSQGPDPGDAPADTGGTPPQRCVNPLRDVLTAKKVNIKQVREVLQGLSDAEHWVNADLDPGPPVIPPPLFFAIGATLPQVVAVLLEFSADVRRRFKGPKVYNGWIKPDATPIEAVENRKGRFVGTMLGDRLEEVLVLLRMAEVQGKDGKEEQQARKKRLSTKLENMISEELKPVVLRPRKSVLLPGAHGSVQHTQGDPSLQYEVTHKIGEGALSTVSLAVHRQSSEQRAIKAEMKFEEWVIWDEIAIMRKLYHPNVIRLWETFEDNTNIFVVLEACTGGELFNRLATEGGVPENHAARLMQQLASAVKYIHSERICHRDIQPENFLLKDDGPLADATVKLIDFTTAKEFGPSNQLKTKICTLHYVAPEILSKKELPYTEKVDVWSLGVVFFVILCGVPPFYGDSEVAVLKKIKRGSFKFNPTDVWSKISKEAKDLVQEMLVVDVENRYSADDVTNHPWLSRDFKTGKQSMQNHLSTEQLNSLRNFHARNRVQKVVQRLRAHDLSSAAIEELRDIFQRLDKDSSGEVHISSIRDKIRRIPALNENIEEIMRVLWSLEHGTGKVKFDDFLKALVARQNQIQEEACRAIFDVFDFDGNGTMSKEELTTALGIHHSQHTSFKAGVETVFGMSVSDVEARFTDYLDKEEYTFEKFFDIMKQGFKQR